MTNPSSHGSSRPSTLMSRWTMAVTFRRCANEAGRKGGFDSPASRTSVRACQVMASTGSLAEGRAAHSPRARGLWNLAPSPPRELFPEEPPAAGVFLLKSLILLDPVFEITNFRALVDAENAHLELVFVDVRLPQPLELVLRHLPVLRQGPQRLVVPGEGGVCLVNRDHVPTDQVRVRNVQGLGDAADDSQRRVGDLLWPGLQRLDVGGIDPDHRRQGLRAQVALLTHLADAVPEVIGRQGILRVQEAGLGDDGQDLVHRGDELDLQVPQAAVLDVHHGDRAPRHHPRDLLTLLPEEDDRGAGFMRQLQLHPGAQAREYGREDDQVGGDDALPVCLVHLPRSQLGVVLRRGVFPRAVERYRVGTVLLANIAHLLVEGVDFLLLPRRQPRQRAREVGRERRAVVYRAERQDLGLAEKGCEPRPPCQYLGSNLEPLGELLDGLLVQPPELSGLDF